MIHFTIWFKQLQDWEVKFKINSGFGQNPKHFI